MTVKFFTISSRRGQSKQKNIAKMQQGISQYFSEILKYSQIQCNSFKLQLKKSPTFEKGKERRKIPFHIFAYL